MENNIKLKDLKDYVNKLMNNSKHDPHNILCLDYLNFVKETIKNYNETLDRDGLNEYLQYALSDFDDAMWEKDIKLLSYEIDDLASLNREIAKNLLPTWKDNSHYFNLGQLIQAYNLDIDELYFDETNNCIRDKEGNIWAE